MIKNQSTEPQHVTGAGYVEKTWPQLLKDWFRPMTVEQYVREHLGADITVLR